jgi:hypothetical protein
VGHRVPGWHPRWVTGTHVIARLRARLLLQVAPPLVVSPSYRQHVFDETSAAYSEIEVRDGAAFAIVVVLGSLPSEAFVCKVWHRYADEVWLVDVLEQAISIVPKEGSIRVFATEDTLRSRRLPGIAIRVRQLFELAS